MKVCEYEEVCCPFCKEEDKLKVDPIVRAYDIETKKWKEIRLGKTSLNQHYILCESCGGVFFIPCED